MKLSPTPLVRHSTRAEQLMDAGFLETKEQELIREANFILRQVFSRQMSWNSPPAFVRMQNSLKTEAHPENDETSGNACIVASHPLTEGKGKQQIRTYIMYVEKLQAFVEFSFSGKPGKTDAEREVMGSIDLISQGKRPRSRPTQQRDFFDRSKPNMWDPAYVLGVDLHTLEMYDGEMTIQQSTPEKFLKAAELGFSTKDPSEQELLGFSQEAVKTLPTSDLGKLRKVTMQPTIGPAGPF